MSIIINEKYGKCVYLRCNMMFHLILFVSLFVVANSLAIHTQTWLHQYKWLTLTTFIEFAFINWSFSLLNWCRHRDFLNYISVLNLPEIDEAKICCAYGQWLRMCSVKSFSYHFSKLVPLPNDSINNWMFIKYKGRCFIKIDLQPTFRRALRTILGIDATNLMTPRWNKFPFETRLFMVTVWTSLFTRGKRSTLLN